MGIEAQRSVRARAVHGAVAVAKGGAAKGKQNRTRPQTASSTETSEQGHHATPHLTPHPRSRSHPTPHRCLNTDASTQMPQQLCPHPHSRVQVGEEPAGRAPRVGPEQEPLHGRDGHRPVKPGGAGDAGHGGAAGRGQG